MLNGGAGDDELTGGTAADTDTTDTDTFVFGTGDGDDVINDFNIGTDRINLSAFELDDEDLAAMITTRGSGDNSRVLIDLRDVGGGTIELAGITSVDQLDLAGDDVDTTANEESDGVIQELNVVMDATDATDEGVFIL